MKFRFYSFTRIVLLLLLVLFQWKAIGQKKRADFQYNHKQMKIVGSEEKKDRLNNTVIVKLKPEYASFFEQANTTIKQLLYPLDIQQINPLFSSTPASKERKQQTVNLGLIYVIQYLPSTMDFEGTINFLNGFGYFEYVEPYYIPTASMAYRPNDPESQPGGGQDFHFSQMQVYDAWGVAQGDPSVIIGVVDTGFRIDHPDLQNNYVAGWDVADNDANVIHPTDYHGTEVAGVCSAEADNGIAGAGTGFKCKFMPIKAAPDGGNAIVAGYQGIQYAADHGCKVINLSWGGIGGYSSALQDIINYAAIDHDIVVLGAAGNSDIEADFYPASYENMMSVAALDTVTDVSSGEIISIRTNFRNFAPGILGATYSYNVDIAAQGVDVFTTNGDLGYTYQTGSSLSTPLVSGAAGVLRAKYPTMTALQIIELLRVTADTFYQYTQNMPFFEKIGKGRLNMYRAATDVSSPAIRMRSFVTSGKHGTYLLAGDTISLTFDLWNYLRKTDNLTVSLSCNSSSITILNPSINPGVIDSMQGIITTALPFKFKINSSANINEKITFRLRYIDPAKGYYDYQYFSILINPNMLDISTSKILSTITANGLIGFDAQGNGKGVQYNGFSVLYEGGLLIGAPSNRVSDCVRGTSGTPDNEFKVVNSPKYIDPAYKDMEIQNKFNDSLAGSIIGIEVEQRSYTFDQTGLDQSFIVEYQIKNNTPTVLDTLYAALFFDWDIGPGSEYNKNRAGFDYTRKMGYAYSTIASRPYTGVELLTKENVTYYAMDNGTVPDVSNINPNSGAWSSTLKYKCMKNGVGRAAAGMTNAGGFDISNMTGAELLSIAPGEVRTVAFAILVADNLTSLQTNADNIKTKFVSMKTSKLPTGAVYYLCENETKDITFAPGNGNNFNFYDHLADINKIASGITYVVPNVSTADTIYAAGADSLYESTSRAALYVNNTATAKANFGTQTTTLTLPSDATLYMFSSSQNYTSLTWDYGDGDGNVNVTNTSHTYTAADVYTVTLTATDDKGCSSVQQKTITATVTTGIKIFPNPATKSIGFGNDIKEPGNLQFINSIGQVLYEKDNILLSEQTGIDVINWPEGVYTVVFNTEKKQYIEHLLIRR